MRNFSKNIDVLLSYCELKIVDPSPHLRGSGGWGKLLIVVMLIYSYWVIIEYSEKFSDIIVLEESEVYSTKKPI